MVTDNTTDNNTPTNIDTIVFGDGVFSFYDFNYLTSQFVEWIKRKTKSFDFEKEDVYCAMDAISDVLKAWVELHKHGQHLSLADAKFEFERNGCKHFCYNFLNEAFEVFENNGPRLATWNYRMLLESLNRRGYKLYYLHDICQYDLDYLRSKKQRYETLALFKGGVFSCDTPWCMADDRIYQFLIDKYDINPKSAVFVGKDIELIHASRFGFDVKLATSTVSDIGSLNMFYDIKSFPDINGPKG